MSTPTEVSTTNIMENSRMIHIGAEIVVISGLAFYVVYQNKQLTARIQQLSDKLSQLDEKEDSVDKLEAVITQLNGMLAQMGQMGQKLQQHENGLNMLSDRISEMSNGSVEVKKPVRTPLTKTKASVIEVGKREKPQPLKHIKPLLKETPPVGRVSKIQFKKPVVEEDTSEKALDDLSDSDLDDEITQELAELEELSDEESSLKKTQ